jgi:hypothetical protein
VIALGWDDLISDFWWCAVHTSLLFALILLCRGNIGFHLAIFLPAYFAAGIPLAQDIERIFP